MFVIRISDIFSCHSCICSTLLHVMNNLSLITHTSMLNLINCKTDIRLLSYTLNYTFRSTCANSIGFVLTQFDDDRRRCEGLSKVMDIDAVITKKKIVDSALLHIVPCR